MILPFKLVEGWRGLNNEDDGCGVKLARLVFHTDKTLCGAFILSMETLQEQNNDNEKYKNKGNGSGNDNDNSNCNDKTKLFSTQTKQSVSGRTFILSRNDFFVFCISYLYFVF